MARRPIGQEHSAVGFSGDRQTPLDAISTLIDWADMDRRFDGIHAASKGEAGWPPLAMFKALLLATWHDLSDVKLAEALADRASFRRFCGFSASELTPERTAFVRFRGELIQRGLDRALFEGIAGQLKARGVSVRTGTLVDATLIPSASIHAHRPGHYSSINKRTYPA